MKSLTRKEIFMDAISSGSEAPTPLTREEIALKNIANSSGGGGSSGGGVLVVTVNSGKASHTRLEIFSALSENKLVVVNKNNNIYNYESNNVLTNKVIFSRVFQSGTDQSIRYHSISIDGNGSCSVNQEIVIKEVAPK